MEVTSGLAEVNGTHLYYEFAGQGEDLVFIHGLGLDRRMWDPQFEPFAQDYRVLRYDLREFGKSEARSATRFSHAEDLRALLDSLEIPKAHLIALSKGGPIALAHALLYPAATRSLVLVDSALDGFAWSERFDRSLDAIQECGRANGAAAANDMWLEHELFAPAREGADCHAALARMVGDYSGSFWIDENLQRGLRPSSIKRLHDVRAPALVLVGERDIQDFQRIAETLASGIPGARRATIRGAGHMSNMERPAEFNALVLSFLREV